MRFFVLLKARTFILVNQWKACFKHKPEKLSHFGEGRCSVGSGILLASLAQEFAMTRGELFSVKVLEFGPFHRLPEYGNAIGCKFKEKHPFFFQINLKGSLITLTNFHGEQFYVGIELNLRVAFCSCSEVS